MKHFTTIEKRSREHVLASLRELDHLYRSDSLAEYEKRWQNVAQQVQQEFPGFRIAYAEIYMVGSERTAHGGMRHVLVPHSESRVQ